MRTVFFLTSGAPFPVVGARRIRDAQILSLLAPHFRIELLATGAEDLLPLLEPQRRAFFERGYFRETGLSERVNLSVHPADAPFLGVETIERLRPHFARGASKSMESYLRARAKPGDIVWLSRLRMAKYIPLARKLGCHAVFDEHQIESDLMFDNAFTRPRYWHQGLNAFQCALYERSLSSKADLVVTAAEVDSARLSKLAPNSRVVRIPFAIETAHYDLAETRAARSPEPARAGEAPRANVLFYADFDYEPNVHAAEWLHTEVYPRLVSAYRGDPPRIVVAGQSIPDRMRERLPFFELRTYADPAEWKALAAEATIAVFPLRYGRGNRISLLEAMAAAMPVVSTGKGADGILAEPNVDLLLADERDEFTSAILRALRDPALRASLSLHARKRVEKRYDFRQTEGAMRDLLERLA